jgi:hypothetical protein
MRIALVLAILTVAPASAQPQAERDTGTPIVGHLAFALGAGSIPRAFEPNCNDGWDGSTASVAVEMRGGISWRRIGIEVRTAPHTEAGLGGAADCLLPDPIRPDGIHSIRSSPIDRGPFIQSDIRLSYMLRRQPFEWLVSGGGGLVWGREVPAVVFGTGVRFGTDLRGVIDAEFNTWRLPWDEITQEWFNEEVVREVDRRSKVLWQHGLAVRVGLELLIGR